MTADNASAIRGFCTFVSLLALLLLGLLWAEDHVDNPECTSFCLYTKPVSEVMP